MKFATKLIAVSAVVRAVSIAAVPTPALAGEYCVTDSPFFKGCDYGTLAECRATVSGTVGSCSRNPWYQDARAAMVYQPKQHRFRNKQPADE
jgi:Protein of unknown function (DUF3551)